MCAKVGTGLSQAEAGRPLWQVEAESPRPLPGKNGRGSFKLIPSS